MSRISFLDMQTFINYVTENSLKYGLGYKQALIDYCTVVYFGKGSFDSNSIADIYDENYDILVGAKNNVDKEQYETILKAIDDELDRKIKIEAAQSVMSNANKVFAELCNKAIELLDKIDKNMDEMDMSQVKDMAGIISKLGENVSSDSLVKALIDNNVISKISTAKSTKKKPIKKVDTTKDGE